MRALVRQISLVAPTEEPAAAVPSCGVTVALTFSDLNLELRELTCGGFAVVTDRPFWRGMTHRFAFASRSGLSVSLVAKAVQSSRLADGDEPRFVTQWTFMAGSAERTEAAIGRLLDG